MDIEMLPQNLNKWNFKLIDNSIELNIENDPETFLELLTKYYNGKFQFQFSKYFNKNIFLDEINFFSFMWTGILLFYLFSIKKGFPGT